MPTFQVFFLKDNNEKKPESHTSQKVNSKREEKEKMPVPYRGQKVDVREEKHPTSRAQKSQKVMSTTCINAENEPKDLHPYIGQLAKDEIREQSRQYPYRLRTGHTVKPSTKIQEAII